ncbi:MAG: putative salt-induced outer membrane protein [Kiritimatiellia bacterium]|jgi:putative salt-induced outer membrane protein
MGNLFTYGLCSLLAVFSLNASAQEESSVATQLELGAIFTSGNTENENVKYKVTVDWNQSENWDYQFTSDGFRSSQDGVSNAQRLYHTGSGNYTINPDSYVQGRLAYENDKFSGFESQSDITVSYGRNMLQSRANMTLGLTAGVGVRRSETEFDTESVAIARLAANYAWNVSESADFIQDFSIETGSDSSIYRSETGIQTDIRENLSLKFSVKVKHQTDVPINREKTDTETAITLVLNF